jgi:hypothetical protein
MTRQMIFCLVGFLVESRSDGDPGTILHRHSCVGGNDDEDAESSGEKERWTPANPSPIPVG